MVWWPSQQPVATPTPLQSSVSFHKRKQPLVALRQIKSEQFGGIHTLAHAKHVTRAQMIMQRTAALQ